MIKRARACPRRVHVRDRAEPAEREPGEVALEHSGIPGAHLQQEAGGRFREEEDEILGGVVLARRRPSEIQAPRPPARPSPPGRPPARLAQVVAAPDESVRDRRMEGPEEARSLTVSTRGTRPPGR